MSMVFSKERVVIIVLILLVVWLSSAVIRLENYHYASQVGMCNDYEYPLEWGERDNCLNEKETRTSPIWHLLYGLNIL
jgi:hypothetical protein